MVTGGAIIKLWNFLYAGTLVCVGGEEERWFKRDRPNLALNGVES